MYIFPTHFLFPDLFFVTECWYCGLQATAGVRQGPGVVTIMGPHMGRSYELWIHTQLWLWWKLWVRIMSLLHFLAFVIVPLLRVSGSVQSEDGDLVPKLSAARIWCSQLIKCKPPYSNELMSTSEEISDFRYILASY